MSSKNKRLDSEEEEEENNIPKKIAVKEVKEVQGAEAASDAAAMAVDSGTTNAIQEWKISYMGRIASVARGLINYIKDCYQGPPELLSSRVVLMRRLLSSAGQDSYEQYDEFAGTYGLNSSQDVGIVYKNYDYISVIRHSHESRPKFLKHTTKIVELAVACLYAIYFKTGKMFNTLNKIMVVCVSDVNPNRPGFRGWHKDRQPQGAWLKSKFSDEGVESRTDKIYEDVTKTLNYMNYDNPLPSVVSIGFKTIATTPIIITNIKENNTITYTTATPARGNLMPSIYLKNQDLLHETPGPVNMVAMQQDFTTNFPGNEMPDDVINDMTKYNNYITLSADQIRAFERKCFFDRIKEKVDAEMIRQMLYLEGIMISSAAITIIDGVINIQNPYVLHDLEANLNQNFPGWEMYSSNNGFNLLQRLSRTGGTNVNISELQGCPTDFHLIRHKKFTLTGKKTKEIKDYGYGGYNIDGTYVSGPYTGDRPIVPKDLTVFQKVSDMNIANLEADVYAVIASQNNPGTTRIEINTDSITCRPLTTRKGGKHRKSRSKTKQKRNKKRNTKKKYYFKKGRKISQRRKFSQRRKSKKR